MIETGSKWGMQTMDQAIAELVATGQINPADGLAEAGEIEKLQRLIAQTDAVAVARPAGAKPEAAAPRQTPPPVAVATDEDQDPETFARARHAGPKKQLAPWQ
jgi:hypothetical protein